MQLCVYTYDQYTANQNNSQWTIPSPYKIEKVLYSYEKNNSDPDILDKIPFGFIATKQSLVQSRPLRSESCTKQSSHI